MKQITVTERVFNAFHNWLVKIHKYSCVNGVYRRNGFRATLKQNKHGDMNEPMAREFKQFLSDWLKHGKEFIEVLS